MDKIAQKKIINFRKALERVPREAAAFVFLTILTLIVLFHFVNLQPEVDENFFFSSDDPQFQSEHLISKLFLRRDTQLIISAKGKIESPEYFLDIQNLTDEISRLAGVTSVTSLSSGPNDLKDALDSPLWKRLLIAHDQKATHLIILIEETRTRPIVEAIEEIVETFSPATKDFKLQMSGLPYVVELIRRNLVKDIKVFSALAFLIFGLVIYFIFRSKSILFGTLLCAVNACAWTFMVTDLFHVPIGLLTANLATIIFVLTLSHIVFLTFNWKKTAEDNPKARVMFAVRSTWAASFWSMLTTLLGFLSLLSVPAKPLRQLGFSGSVGTLCAFLAVYGLYPAFLKLKETSLKKTPERSQPDRSISISRFFHKIYAFLEKEKKSIYLLVAFFFLLTIPGLAKLNTDPPLLSFFSETGEIFKGLAYIDRNGGSNPLLVVVRSREGWRLNSQRAYDQLWKLQEALELHPSVGSVISLPVLMAQAKKEPLAMFVFWDWLLDILEKPAYGEIAKSFVTGDRRFGLFLLRMNELNRVQPRFQIIEEIKEIARTRGFEPKILGGVYILQGHLAKLVASSLVLGLILLLCIFGFIGWLLSRSWTLSLSMIASIAILPVMVLGFLGLYGIPLDVISAPALNIALAIGVDAMIHMVKGYRRRLVQNKETACEQIWSQVRKEFWPPILSSLMVIAAGFGIFLFSVFPPTQRFGLIVILGTFLSALSCVFVMPFLAQWNWKKRGTAPS